MKTCYKCGAPAPDDQQWKGYWYCSKCLDEVIEEGHTVPPPPPLEKPKPGFIIQDSGEHETLETGMVRDSKVGKGRNDLVSPIFNKRLAQHYESGAHKYSERNWEKGAPMSKHFDSAVRHLNDYLEGKRDEDHLIAAAWNIAAMVHVEEMANRGLLPKELCDMPNFMGDQE